MRVDIGYQRDVFGGVGEVKLKTSLVVDEEPEGRCKGTCWNETLLAKEEEKKTPQYQDINDINDR